MIELELSKAVTIEGADAALAACDDLLARKSMPLEPVSVEVGHDVLHGDSDG